MFYNKLDGLILVSIIVALMIIPFAAHAQEAEKKFNLSLSAEKEAIAGRQLGMSLTVTNLDNSTVTVKQASLVLPVNWTPQIGDLITLNSPTAINSTGSKLFRFYFTVPSDAAEGTYKVFANVTLSKSTEVTFADITVKKAVGEWDAKLSADRKEVFIGKQLGMSLLITNSDSHRTINVTAANLLIPSNGTSPSTASFNFATPMAISPNSSKIIRGNFSLQGFPEGTYSIYANVTAMQGKSSSSKITSFDITVKNPPIGLASVKWDEIWILLLIYTIPGGAIERVVESLRHHPILGANTPKEAAEAEASKLVVEKLTDEFQAIRTAAVGAPAPAPAAANGAANSAKTKTSLQAAADAYLDLIKTYKKKPAEENSKVVFRTLALAFFIALVPAFFLAINGVGLLQVITRADTYWGADIFIGAAGIAFITKPTHEIFTAIEKIRGVIKK